MKYFVMLIGADGSPIPMIDSDDEVWDDKIKLFDTEKEAEDCACINLFGQTYGFEVMEWDWMEEDR